MLHAPNHLWIVIAAWGLLQKSLAQRILHPDSGYCAADKLSAGLLRARPDLAEAWTRALHRQTGLGVLAGARDTGANYTIPVVVHIIHQDGTENISPAQIWNGLDILNRNFRKRNPDTSEIVPFFKPLAADCEIHFLLARRDPNGNCHPGYHRIRSPATLTGGHEVKDLIQWPRDKYLNIYVCRDAAGLAGHALMPFQADTLPQWDGIVIRYDYYGNTGTSNDFKSVVLTHEAGHYLNLFHVWGGNNVPGFYYLPVGHLDNCNHDDAVADTPPTIGWTVCNLSANSCDSLPDNVQNFMDYAYCARMFTEGQKQRMHAALNSPVAERNQLWTAANLQAIGLDGPATLCEARIWAPRMVACVGEALHFYDDSYHGALNFLWDFGDGSTSSDRHPIHTYTQSGTYDVTLTVSDGTTALTQTAVALVRVNPPQGLPLPWSQTFDLGLHDLHEHSEPAIHSQLDAQAAWSLPHSLMLEESQAGSGARVVLTSPPLNLSLSANPAITFRYAFARRHLDNQDKLVLKISRDCGKTWITRFTAEGDSLETTYHPAPSHWIPDSVHWRRVVVANVPAAYRTDGFMFRLEFYPDGGHPLRLDNLLVDELSQISNQEKEKTKCFAFPNPALDRLFLQDCPTLQGKPLRFTNLLGQSHLLYPSLDGSYDIRALKPGIWAVQGVGMYDFSCVIVKNFSIEN